MPPLRAATEQLPRVLPGVSAKLPSAHQVHPGDGRSSTAIGTAIGLGGHYHGLPHLLQPGAQVTRQAHVAGEEGRLTTQGL